MTQEHNYIGAKLGRRLSLMLPESDWGVSVDAARIRVASGNTYNPDVAVISIPAMAALRGTGHLETYDVPVPFVAEVWSPSTGGHDVEDKFPEYKARGDLEIWRIHPYERTITAWRRQPDGGYAEQLHTGGKVPIASLPNVTIDFEELFTFP
jgi:Uma2 family endonuclease